MKTTEVQRQAIRRMVEDELQPVSSANTLALLNDFDELAAKLEAAYALIRGHAHLRGYCGADGDIVKFCDWCGADVHPPFPIAEHKRTCPALPAIRAARL